MGRKKQKTFGNLKSVLIRVDFQFSEDLKKVKKEYEKSSNNKMSLTEFTREFDYYSLKKIKNFDF